jgi:hypothetical protein
MIDLQIGLQACYPIGVNRNVNRLIFSLVGIAVASPLCARVISIQTQVETTSRQDGIQARVTLKNGGDEAARSVYVEARSPVNSAISKTKPELGVGENFQVDFDFKLKTLKPGRYPLVLTTHYSDTNDYPFSALTVSPLDWKKAAAAGVVAYLGNVSIDQNGNLPFKIKNMQGDTKQLSMRLLAPAELSVVDPARTVSIQPDSEVRGEYSVKNFSALVGSTYLVVATIEYDNAGVHYATVAPGRVAIGQPGFLTIVKRSAGPALVVVGLLALLIGGRLFWERRQRQGR